MLDCRISIFISTFNHYSDVMQNARFNLLLEVNPNILIDCLALYYCHGFDHIIYSTPTVSTACMHTFMYF